MNCSIVKYLCFSLTASLLLLACSKDSQNSDSSTNEELPAFGPAGKIELTTKQSQVLGANNTFAFKLLQRVFDSSSDENLFFSPFSIQAALSLVLNGAGGETYTQLVEVFEYGNYSLEEINSMYSAVSEGLKSVDKTVRFFNANSIWLNQLQLQQKAKSDLETYYEAYIQSVDFSSPKVVDSINEWCAENTNNKISKIVEEIGENTQILLLNALYFEGSWKDKFDVASSNSGVFSQMDGGSSEITYMHKISNLVASEKNGVKYCKLYFGNGAYSISMFLPDKEIDYKQFVSCFDIAEYQALIETEHIYRVNLSIPKMSYDYTITDNLEKALVSLGIKDAFDIEKADLSGLVVDTNSHFIDSIKQKTHFEMDEEGAKVAAVTEIDGSGAEGEPSKEPESMVFNANHPFVFLISESSTGAILLMGSFVGK